MSAHWILRSGGCGREFHFSKSKEKGTWFLKNSNKSKSGRTELVFAFLKVRWVSQRNHIELGGPRVLGENFIIKSPRRRVPDFWKIPKNRGLIAQSRWVSEKNHIEFEGPRALGENLIFWSPRRGVPDFWSYHFSKDFYQITWISNIFAILLGVRCHWWEKLRSWRDSEWILITIQIFVLLETRRRNFLKDSYLNTYSWISDLFAISWGIQSLLMRGTLGVAGLDWIFIAIHMFEMSKSEAMEDLLNMKLKL